MAGEECRRGLALRREAVALRLRIEIEVAVSRDTAQIETASVRSSLVWR
jgi:hypothetical protein